ncbi:hypothetical protein VT84_00180 [Gemmata sp. SH-PL17]|uniref:hypothetical protein n=1 Tax=Gemmata sp. SH-PL17 TaxID=1630693 RepID=UPI00078E3770|nr:hypothetical protein [Gemmata sp. SH-PL17]AMV22794.1 hypothetical protein VT84_00180 [Gemmata sp. SH-PL17]
MSVWLAALLAPVSPPPVPEAPAPRYYFILFAGQSVPFHPRTAHTWATFVKTTPGADGKLAVEHVTISWLPAQGPVQPLRVRPVAGKNYTLEETFAKAEHNGSRMSMWGPFETDALRYELAVEQVRTLNSGAVRFRSIDSFCGNRKVQHCVHAVTYADPNLQHLIQPVLRVGEPDTSKLAAKYAKSGAFVGTQTHDWLLPVLGLDQHPLVRREPGERIPRRWQ